METKKFYSKRKGNMEEVRLSLSEVINYFDDMYKEYKIEGCFRKLDDEISNNYKLFSIENFNNSKLLPYTKMTNYNEDDIFDLIELHYQYITEPVKLSGTSSGSSVYNPLIKSIKMGLSKNLKSEKEYKAEFRKRINRIISKYGEGFYLTEDGEIQKEVSVGLDRLIKENENGLPVYKENLNEIEEAKALFLHHKATVADKRNALLVLGRVLEENRKEIKKLFMSKDESELFELLNRYNIRHSDLSQKKDYPTDIYFDWIFYNLLSAIDAYFKISSYSVDE
jgi:hypothetical protein